MTSVHIWIERDAPVRVDAHPSEADALQVYLGNYGELVGLVLPLPVAERLHTALGEALTAAPREQDGGA